MKKTFLTFALFAVLGSTPPVVSAQHEHAEHHDVESLPTETKLTEGSIKKIDKLGGKLTIAHGPIEDIGMPAMTMVFRVSEPSALEQVKVGDRIRFAVEKVGDSLMITTIEQAQ